MDNQKEPEKSLVPEIKIAKMQTLSVYPMYLHELEELAMGLPIPLFLNFSIFCLSLSGSLMGSILLPISTIGFMEASTTLIILFSIACVIFIIGVILLFVWLWRGKKVKKITQQIKNRMPKSASNNKI